LGEVLLKPTRIYSRPINKLLQMESFESRIHGMAHITGGGLVENTERVLPENCRLVIHENSWPIPAVYQWFQSLRQVKSDEMARVFNMGIGYVIIAEATAAEEIMQTLTANGETVWRIGEIQAK
jgi:phosphoribosylaminoimidazole (AIR) synthetase